jgi:recombination protein RecT
MSNLATAAASAVATLNERAGGRPSIPSLLNAGWLAQQIQRQLGGTEDDAQSFVRSVITAVKAAPDLARCNPESIYGGMFAAAQLGLPIGGGLKQAYLIPRKDRNDEVYGWSATFQVGYPGLIKLATNTGLVVGVDTIKVMQGDRFRKGANSERGKYFDLIDGDNSGSTDDNLIVGIIGMVWIRGATKPQWRYLTREQIEARRPDHTKEQTGKNGSYVPNTPWKTDWGPMAEKTAVIEALKFAPKSERLQLAISADDAIVTAKKESQDMVVSKPEIHSREIVEQRPVAETPPPEDAHVPDDVPPEDDRSAPSAEDAWEAAQGEAAFWSHQKSDDDV